MRLIFLLMLCGTGFSSVIRRNLWYVYHQPMTWQDAKAYCQSISAELVTVVTQSEIDNTNMDNYYAWIALRKYDEWNWVDIYNNYTVANDTFVENEPGKDDDCAMANYFWDRAVGYECEKRHFFLCHYHEKNKRKYRFYLNAKSWDDAFHFCKDTNTLLAIFNNWNDRPSDKKDFPVWTGLYHDGESWRWSDGEYSDFWKWAPGFDNGFSPGSGQCGSVWSQNKTMSVHSCSEAFPFLCYTHNLVLVKQNLTWEEALEHCKAISPTQPHQLLSVEQSELLYANSKAIDAQTDKVWLGLRFLGGSWFWSNGQTVSLPGLPPCPESTLGCGALVLRRTSNGSDPQPTIELNDCSERLNLLCYRLY